MTAYLSNRFRVVAFWLMSIIALAGGCNHERSTPQGVAATSSEITQAHVGKQVTIRGEFSLNGKFGPFVLLENQQVIYLESKGESFEWGDYYSPMESKQIEATGTLRFYHSPDAEQTDNTRTRAPSHYYLEAETAKLRLISE